jgi:membrane protease YdiL (CAAX protease family)
MTHARRDRDIAAGVALAFVYFAVAVFWRADIQSWRWMDSDTISGLFKVAVWVVPAAVIPVLVYRVRAVRVPGELGLDASALGGIAFGLVTTIPMAIAAAFSGFARVTPDYLCGAVLLGPFAEEVLFRGFLFRELLARARWPLAWALVVSSVGFGAAHLDASAWGPRGIVDQVMTAGSQFMHGDLSLRQYGIGLGRAAAILGAGVAIPAAGGAVFGWVFYRSRNLWMAIGLHACVNLWATISYQVGRGGPDATSVAETTSLVAAVALVEWQHRRAGQVPC